MERWSSFSKINAGTIASNSGNRGDNFLVLIDLKENVGSGTDFHTTKSRSMTHQMDLQILSKSNS